MRIETERLVLRRWRDADVDALAEIHASEAMVAWLGPLTRDDAAATIARYEHHWDVHGFGRFAVDELLTGQLVGRVGVMRQPDWSETPERDEIGWVVRADRWGEGFATEAAAASIADAFERVRLPRILSWTLPENAASRRVMEKCGLELGGIADWKGQPHVWYAIGPSAGDETCRSSRVQSASSRPEQAPPDVSLTPAADRESKPRCGLRPC